MLSPDDYTKPNMLEVKRVKEENLFLFSLRVDRSNQKCLWTSWTAHIAQKLLMVKTWDM